MNKCYILRNIYIFLDILQNNETDQETESDRESTQNSSFGRTSLGRTVLNAFNERSLFNKKVQESSI